MNFMMQFIHRNQMSEDSQDYKLILEQLEHSRQRADKWQKDFEELNRKYLQLQQENMRLQNQQAPNQYEIK